MFDCVVFSGPDPEPAARTLAGLVEGVVDGVLGRMLLVSAATGGGLDALAEASGCRLEQGVPPRRLAEVLAGHLTTPHVLAFEAGALVPVGWPQLLGREFERRGEPGTAVALAFRPQALGARLRLIAAIGVKGGLPLAHGALLPKARLTDRGFTGGAVKTYGPIHLTEMSVGRVR